MSPARRALISVSDKSGIVEFARGLSAAGFGIVSTGFNIGGIIGPLLFGWLMDHGSPRGVFAMACAFTAT